MATIAGELIEEARDTSPAFTRGAIPDIGALGALSRIEQQLAQAVVMEEPDALAAWNEIGVPLPVAWEDGIALPAFQMVLAPMEVIYTASPHVRWEVPILSAGQTRSQPHMYPSVSIVGNLLFLTDARLWLGQYHGWEELTRLRFRYVPEITPIATERDPITLPDTARSALVANLALWMAQRLGNVPTSILREAETSGQAWVMGMLNRASGRSWLVEVVE
jgi:hypothetical protein